MKLTYKLHDFSKFLLSNLTVICEASGLNRGGLTTIHYIYE